MKGTERGKPGTQPGNKGRNPGPRPASQVASILSSRVSQGMARKDSDQGKLKIRGYFRKMNLVGGGGD